MPYFTYFLKIWLLKTLASKQLNLYASLIKKPLIFSGTIYVRYLLDCSIYWIVVFISHMHPLELCLKSLILMWKLPKSAGAYAYAVDGG